MPDYKVISASAKDLSANVSDGSVEANIVITEVQGNISSIAHETAVPDLQLNIILDNLGEDLRHDPRLFKYLEDFTSSIIDRIALSPKIVKTDSFTTSDTFNRLFNSKRFFEEYLPTSDVVLKRIGKGVQDVSSLADVTSFRVRPVFLEFMFPTDAPAFKVDKNLQDNANSTEKIFLHPKPVLQTTTGPTTDILSRVVNYNRTFIESPYFAQDYIVEPYTYTYLYLNVQDFVAISISTTKLELVGISEDIRVTTAKPVNDNFAVSDVFSKVSEFRPTILDFVYPTDDIYGEANVDDDQYAWVQKNLEEHQSTSELIVKVINRQTPAETVSQSDAIDLTVLFNRLNLETSSVLDNIAIVVDFNRAPEETLTTLDDFSRVVVFNRELSEVGLSSDLFSRTVTFNRSEVDNTTANDLFSNVTSFVRQPVETITSSDTFSRLVVFDRVVSENLISSDDFNRVVVFNRTILESSVISDIILKQLSKTNAESVSNSDLVFLNPNKRPSETVVTSENGFMNNQGYFLQNYVIPGYVGTNYTF